MRSKFIIQHARTQVNYQKPEPKTRELALDWISTRLDGPGHQTENETRAGFRAPCAPGSACKWTLCAGIAGARSAGRARSAALADRSDKGPPHTSPAHSVQ